MSVSGSRGRMDYTLGIDNSANHSGAGGPTTIYNADGSIRLDYKPVIETRYKPMERKY